MTRDEAGNGRQRVVVTGLGVASPLGSTVETFWKALLAGHSGVVATDDPRLARCRTRVVAPVQGFDPGAHFSRVEQTRLNRATQLALVAAQLSPQLRALCR